MPAPSPSSLIDAVDESNTPVGTVRRDAVFDLGANFRTVHVLVFNNSGQLLLQQLSSSRQRHPLCWGSSVAGYLHAGESYDQGAVRRVFEELRISPALEPVGVTSMSDENVTKFIGVFRAVADKPVVADRAHVQKLEFWNARQLSAAVHSQPKRFTSTFLHVLDFAGADFLQQAGS